MVNTEKNRTARERVERYIAELAELERKCFATRKKDWAVKYLARVYKLYINWEEKNLANRRRKDLIAYQSLTTTVRKDKTIFHLLFDLTSKADTKVKSRWANALLAAKAQKTSPEDLKEFLLANGKGGIAGRAAEYSKIRKKGTGKGGQENTDNDDW